MRICYVSKELPPETPWGGIATYTAQAAMAMAAAGHEVHVLTYTYGEERTEELDGIQIHKINQGNYPLWLNIFRPLHVSFECLKFSYYLCEKLTALNQKFAFHLIEVPETLALMYFWPHFSKYLSKKDAPKCIVRFHTPAFWLSRLNENANLDSNVRSHLEKRQTLAATAYSSPSSAMADVIACHWMVPKERIEIIPNVYNPIYIERDLSIYIKYLKSLRYGLYFGRLEGRKGVATLAESLPIVLQEIPDLNWVFVGKDCEFRGSTMGAYILSQTSKYINRVIFLPHQNSSKLIPIVENSEIVTFPSKWENFPYVCLESMGLGKTVIASSGSGYDEIIEDGVSGYLVQPGKPEMLAEKIIKCIISPDPKVPEAAKKRVKDFSTEVILPIMERFYDRILRFV